MTKPFNFFLAAALFVSAVMLANPIHVMAEDDTFERSTHHHAERTLSSRRRQPNRSRPAAAGAFLPSFSLGGGESSSSTDNEDIWYEMRPPVTQFDLDPAWSTPPKPARRLVWHGRMTDDEPTWMPSTSRVADTTTIVETTTLPQHPMRTPSWSLQVQWTGKWDKTLPSNLTVDFDTETGYCRARSSSSDVVGIGCWEVHPWGLWFTLADASGSVEYTFTAQLHLNPFGDAAKLLQGSIVRHSLVPLSSSGIDDRKQQRGVIVVSDPIQDEPMVFAPRKWFRPVVGRFSGKGK